MTPHETVCDRCGADANIHITDLVAGMPTIRHFCRICADARGLTDDRPRTKQRAAVASVLATVGLFVLALSLFADIISVGDSAGFGWQQRSGMMVAGIILLLGAVTRTLTLVIVGVITVTLDLLADGLEFGSSPGFGWQQQTGVLVGLGLIFVGLMFTRRRR